MLRSIRFAPEVATWISLPSVKEADIVITEMLELAWVAVHCLSDTNARVAQLDRVTASEAEGCGFNSRRAHQFRSSVFTGNRP